MARLPILLVDDQRLFVDNLRIVLESRTRDLRVAGIALDGREAVEMAEALRPALILMDVRMPVMDGVEATRIILSKHPEMRIIMLTTFDDDQYVSRAMEHGAVGYILKSVSPGELISSIRAVRDGAVLVSPGIADKLVHRRKPRAEPPPTGMTPAETSRVLGSLTSREIEIVKLTALAYENREIGERLSIAEQTVKNALSTIFLKVGVSRRTQLMRFYEDCKKNGLIE